MTDIPTTDPWPASFIGEMVDAGFIIDRATVTTYRHALRVLRNDPRRRSVFVQIWRDDLDGWSRFRIDNDLHERKVAA